MRALHRLVCALRGHDEIPVREVGLSARPGGLLPSLDGYVTYAPDPAGEHRACRRCRQVTRRIPPVTTNDDGADQ